MGLFFNPGSVFLNTNKAPQVISNLQNDLATLKDEKQQLLNAYMELKKIVKVVESEIEQAMRVLEDNFKILKFIKTVLSTTDKNLVLGEEFISMNTVCKKAIRNVLSDIGISPRRHVKSFEMLTRSKKEYEDTIQEDKILIKERQHFLSRRHEEISTIINHRLPLVNQRISQTELEIAQQCLQSILNDSIAPVLNKFS